MQKKKKMKQKTWQIYIPICFWKHFILFHSTLVLSIFRLYVYFICITQNIFRELICEAKEQKKKGTPPKICNLLTNNLICILCLLFGIGFLVGSVCHPRMRTNVAFPALQYKTFFFLLTYSNYDNAF